MSVFVAAFADGETVRMSVYGGSELDWQRGRSIAKHAWQTRDRRYRIEKFLADIEDREPPEITSCHIEVDGQVVEEPKEATESA
jgi:hypothetical protein